MNQTGLSKQEEHLFAVLSGKRFLQMEGLGNEVPFFIYPYPPEDALAVAQIKKRIKNKLSHKGIRVREINLYDLSVEILKDRGVWERVLAAEPAEAALAEIRSETASPYDLVLVGVGRDWGLEARQFGIQQEFLIRQCPTSLLIVRGYDPSLHGDRAKTSAESSQSPDHVQPA